MKQPLASISAVLLLVGAPAAFVQGASRPGAPLRQAQEGPAPPAEAGGNVFAFARQSAHPGS